MHSLRLLYLRSKHTVQQESLLDAVEIHMHPFLQLSEKPNSSASTCIHNRNKCYESRDPGLRNCLKMFDNRAFAIHEDSLWTELYACSCPFSVPALLHILECATATGCDQHAPRRCGKMLHTLCCDLCPAESAEIIRSLILYLLYPVLYSGP